MKVRWQIYNGYWRDSFDGENAGIIDPLDPPISSFA